MVKEAVSAPPFRIPISEKAAAINGAIMASLAANVPLSGVLLCVSLAVIDGVIVLDPSSYEEADARSVHLLGFTFSSTTNKALSISESLGNFNQETGGKNRRRGKNDNENDKRELLFKEEGQEYAQVSRMLGNGRLEASCFDGVKRLGHIRGKMRKKVWVGAGDIVLLSLREFEDEKADIIHKYSPDEARALKQYGELPSEARINENEAFGDDDLEGEIEFGEQEEEGEDDDSEESDVDINDL
ncbi:hypothetical protein E3Q23_01052 [Wallemia mellicola]|uniref:Eukaryotic translation initiation factor 4C n=1 Tax=Wallemia mellicola TaxID=1708541 RepID=A0A4T0PRD3_9BASI|nr:hypothetical protein E3Q23_01052 [Wallemia mellicola]TIB93159.1 hypothetical protein E3Q19_01415 [Wallemia mellicola]TIC12899.1 hypothetical protein E3Q14_01552 [Wallemia mellicola]TIC29578.1 hypothetical protein E3Q11_01330 [Wallemia mellicola]TIC58001.1 hypothetical protein E3Q05_00968 [Wallemia mellicola]